MGEVDIIQHSIDTGNTKLLKQRPYVAPYKLREEVKRQIKELKDNGIIVQSFCPWALPVMPVKKKDGEIRMCVDYRKLNEFTKKDTHPFPKIQEQFNKLSKALWFAIFDANKGFYGLKVLLQNREKTAFVTEDGLYEFTRMQFGIPNAPASFQRLMNTVLIDVEHVIVYMDDILIASESFEQHLINIENMMSRLQKANIKLKPTKCKWAEEQVLFLGHIVSSKGLQPNPDKIEAVKNFPIPKLSNNSKATMD